MDRSPARDRHGPRFVADGGGPVSVTLPPAIRAAVALAVGAASLATAPAPGAAQEVRAGEAEALTISGFVGVTVFAQDRLFGPGNGQNAQFVDFDGLERWWYGGDVRNTRLLLEVAGPSILGDWRAGGTIEMDFFGGFPGTGAFVAEQPLPRLRLAFAEVARGGTAVRLGQDWAPLSGYVPESVTHVAFPLGFGAAGQIGWRFPGVFLFQELGGDERAALRLHAAVMRDAWDDAPDAELPTAGQLAATPQLELRFDADGESRGGTAWGVYTVGHVDRKDFESPFTPGADDRRITGWAVQLGARILPGPVTLHGNAYAARAMGHHAAHISQFGDVRGWGGWIQAGFELDPRWSFWSFFGTDDPRDQDLTAGARLRNRVFTQLVRLEEGPFAVGVEWLHARTLWRSPGNGDPPPRVLRSGNQIAASILFQF